MVYLQRDPLGDLWSVVHIFMAQVLADSIDHLTAACLIITWWLHCSPVDTLVACI